MCSNGPLCLLAALIVTASTVSAQSVVPFVWNVNWTLTGYPVPGVPFTGIVATITYAGPSNVLYYTFDKDGMSEPGTATPVVLVAGVPKAINMGSVTYALDGRNIAVLRVYNSADKRGGPFSPSSLPSENTVVVLVGRDANTLWSYTTQLPPGGGIVTVVSGLSGDYFWSFGASPRYKITVVARVAYAIRLADFIPGSFESTFYMWSFATSTDPMFTVITSVGNPVATLSPPPQAVVLSPPPVVVTRSPPPPVVTRSPPPPIVRSPPPAGSCPKAGKNYICSATTSLYAGQIVKGPIVPKQVRSGVAGKTNAFNDCTCRYLCDADSTCQGYIYKTTRICFLFKSVTGWETDPRTTTVNSCVVTF